MSLSEEEPRSPGRKSPLASGARLCRILSRPSASSPRGRQENGRPRHPRGTRAPWGAQPSRRVPAVLLRGLNTGVRPASLGRSTFAPCPRGPVAGLELRVPGVPHACGFACLRDRAPLLRPFGGRRPRTGRGGVGGFHRSWRCEKAPPCGGAML